jgi:hypothetical protein
MAKHKITTLSEQLVLDLDAMAKKIQEFLIESNVTPKDSRFTSLIESLHDLKVLLKDKYHVGLTFDDNGYIIKAQHFQDFVAYPEKMLVPADLSQGFYLLIDGTVAVDEERKRQIEEV